MSKVITFSTKFPSYHPRAGESTNFVEKIWESLIQLEEISISRCCELSRETGIGNYTMNSIRKINFDPKFHTVRAGHRFKVGDWFSPRIWSGKPYNSKQITIASDIQVKKVWYFTIRQFKDPYFIEIRLDGKLLFEVHNNTAFLGGKETLEKISSNDGLDLGDFEDWFGIQSSSKSFHGQIICWNENIEY